MSAPTQMKEKKEQAENFHKKLPAKLRQYLNDRCISDKTINKFKLGYDGKSITIPIPEQTGAFIFFKHRKDPNKNTAGPKYLYDKGFKAELYGWENLFSQKSYVVLCEGELDRLVLEDRGIPAVTSTGGAGTFLDEWVQYFKEVHRVYICYDNDEAGQANSEKISRKIPHSRVIALPDMGEGKKDITDYFVSGKTEKDFEQLLTDSKTNEELRARFTLQALAMQGDAVDFNPSQQVVNNKLYLTIPAYKENNDEKGKAVFLKSFLVVSNDREIFELENEWDFYKKYAFHVRQLPKVKNQEVRWAYRHILEFTEHGYTPDPYEVFDSVRGVIKKYSELENEEYYDVLALWVMGTYVFQGFESFPYIGFSGMQGSGKSKILKILAFLCFNAQPVVNISEASLFRDIESLRSTVIMDEGEYLNDQKNKPALLAMLNSGYSRGPGVPRQVKDSKGDMSTQHFQVYSPKALANIRGFETVLNSRIINIPMIRAVGERGWVNPSEGSEDWSTLRHGLYSYALCFFKNIQQAYLHDPKTRINNNRSNDLWSPLLSVAQVVFGQHPEGFESFKDFAQKEIVRSSRSGLDEPTINLLVVLRDLVTMDAWYDAETIRARVALGFTLKQAEEIDAEWIGYRLKNFLLFRKKKRTAKGMKYFFVKSRVEDILARYKNEISEDFENEEINPNTGDSKEVSGVPRQPVLFNS